MHNGLTYTKTAYDQDPTWITWERANEVAVEHGTDLAEYDSPTMDRVDARHLLQWLGY